MAQLNDLLVLGYTNLLSTVNAFSDILPNVTNTHSLGTSDLKWKAVYATTLYGNFVGTLTGNITGTASALTNLSSNDQASSTATKRYIWFSYDNNSTGRPAYDNRFTIQTSTGTLFAPTFSGYLSGSADMVDNYHASDLVLKNYNNVAYTALTHYYGAGTKPTYYKVTLPSSQNGLWTMVTMKFLVRQTYGTESAGTLTINAHHNTTDAWDATLNAYVDGTLTTNIKVYAAGQDSFYIGGCTEWATIALEKMIIGDGATGQDLRGVTISIATALPSSYVTATMHYGTPSYVEGRYVKKSGDTMTGVLTVTSDASNKGIKIGSTTYLNAIDKQVIFQGNEGIRFGTNDWDWNCWAGLKYQHRDSSNNVVRILSLGVADGTVFNANAAQSGGTLQFPGISYVKINGKEVFNAGDSWLRINQSSTFSSGIYTGSSLIRSDSRLEVGSGGASFYADINGTGYFDNDVKAKGHIFAYNYGRDGNNAPAFVFDKNGSNYTGIGSHNMADTIWFGAVHSTDFTWVNDYYQNWYFNGNIEAAKQFRRVGISSSWWNGRDNAVLRMTTSAGYSILASMKTTNGTWDIGNYNAANWHDQLLFNYKDDASYANGNSSNSVTHALKLTASGDAIFNGYVTGSRIWTGYDSGETNSISCSNWFRCNGVTGLYNASYGTHLMPNTVSSYAGWRMSGAVGGYHGILFGDATSAMAIMSIDNSHQGLYTQSGTGWIIYNKNDSAQIGIRTSSLTSGYNITLGSTTSIVGELYMNNSNITGVNSLSFADPGVQEGIAWAGGNGWWIYEAPDNLSNGAGNLQFVHGSTRRLTINTDGYVDINARLVVRGNGSSYNEGIRILPASNGWSNVFFSANTTLSDTHDGGWLIGRRGAAGAVSGAVGDFTIEEQNSNGSNLTIHKDSNGATLQGLMRTTRGYQVQRTAGDGYGLGLYGSSGHNSYGIHMSLTSTYGKYGHVQGDWATYFCFDGAVNRGWIFKQAGNNVASINGEGKIYTPAYVDTGCLVLNNTSWTGYGDADPVSAGLTAVKGRVYFKIV